MLGRPPDKIGRWGKIQSLIRGMSEEDMRQTMMLSTEYKVKHTLQLEIKDTLETKRTAPLDNIKLTVGLPLYKAKNIAWVAFESLCRQQGIDFDWELIIIEENTDESLPFGKDKVESYTKRLEEAGCKSIIYFPINQYLPLVSKWFEILDRAAPGSVCMLLQSADCYSSPGRLKETLRLFEDNVDWVHSRIHVIYNILDEKIILYDHIDACHTCGSDMAIRISTLKSIPRKTRESSIKIRSGIDGFLYKQCQLVKKDNFTVIHDTTDNWKYSINVNGMNNISKRGSLIDHYPDKSDIIKPYIPKDILKRLQGLKELL